MSPEERVIVWAGWLGVDRSDAIMFAYAQRVHLLNFSIIKMIRIEK
jgi:hypothetical protein